MNTCTWSMVACQAALAAVLLAGAGCRTAAPSGPAELQSSSAPMLLLPVLPADRSLEAAATDLSRALHRELSGQLGTGIVPARALPPLAPALTAANLRRDGRLNTREMAALATASGCGAALMVELTGMEPYTPQTLTATATVVDAESANVTCELRVILDLANQRTLDVFRDYLERVHAFRVGNLESRPADRMHTAMLSPTVFRGFAAHIIATDILAGTVSAATGTQHVTQPQAASGSASESSTRRVLMIRSAGILRQLCRH